MVLEKYVVIIDDNSDSIFKIEKLFLQKNILAKVFHQYEEIIEQLKKAEFNSNLIIINTSILGINLLNLLSDIKRKGYAKNIPFLFIAKTNTKIEMLNNFNRGLSSVDRGAVDFLSESWTDEDFNIKIDKLLIDYNKSFTTKNTVLNGSFYFHSLKEIYDICKLEKLNGFVKIKNLTKDIFTITTFEEGNIKDSILFDIENYSMQMDKKVFDELESWSHAEFTIRKGLTEDYDDIYPQNFLTQ